MSAARMGAAVVLVERYGHLGGVSTGRFVLWIDRMTDWESRQVITGNANDILERIPDDEIGVSPSPNRRFPNVSVPLNCLAPKSLNGLMAAGRNLSSDPATHSFMREVLQCWLMGQAAELAAASAASAGIRVRDVDVDAARLGLQNQGVVLTRSAQARSDEADSGTDSECAR